MSLLILGNSQMLLLLKHPSYHFVYKINAGLLYTATFYSGKNKIKYDIQKLISLMSQMVWGFLYIYIYIHTLAVVSWSEHGWIFVIKLFIVSKCANRYSSVQ